MEADENLLVVRARRRVGSLLCGRYRLTRLLGLGGMAAVYAGMHARNGHPIAVKVLHDRLGEEPEQRGLFRREALLVNKVSHPGAVPVFDDDEAEDGTTFLVLPLLAGETLRRRWERSAQRLPVEEVVVAARAILDVLAAAHAAGIVHRDVKPDNVFVTTTGEVRVLDFGIARVLESNAGSSGTRTGIVLGTPAFMAPEQARGRSREIDVRTDLWALGATMFQLLSGRAVHEGESPNELLVEAATRPARPLTALARSVPWQIAAVVDRALAFDKGKRWQSAQEMLEALRHAERDVLGRDGREPPMLPALSDENDERLGATSTERVDSPRSASGKDVFEHTRTSDAERVRSLLRSGSEGRAPPPAAMPGRIRGDAGTTQLTRRGRQLLVLLVALALPAAYLVTREVRKTRAAAAETPGPPLVPARPRSKRASVSRTPTSTIRAHPTGALAVAVSPDGALFASGGFDGAVKVRDAKTGEQQASLPGFPAAVHHVKVLADGKHIVASGGTRIDVWDIETERTVLSFTGDDREVSALDVSPDGRWIASMGRADKSIALWDATDGHRAATLSPGFAQDSIALAFRPDGQVIAAGGSDRDIALLLLGGRAPATHLLGHWGTIDALMFSRDGQTLYSTSDDRSLKVWSRDGRLRANLADQDDEVWSLAVNPRGDQVASGTKRGTLSVWNTGTDSLIYPINVGAGITELAFLPDETRVVAATVAGALEVFDLGSRPAAAVPPIPAIAPIPVASPLSPPATLCARAVALVYDASSAGTFTESESLARRALAADERFAQAHLALAYVALKRGYDDDGGFDSKAADAASRWVDLAASEAPGSPLVDLARARVLLANGDWEGASRKALAAETTGPFPAADVVLALAMRRQEATHDDAERYALRALAKHPSRGEAWRAYAALEEVYSERGDYDAASAAFEAEITLTPESTWAKTRYANFLVGIGEYRRAMETASRALAQRDSPAARRALVDAHVQAGVSLAWDYGRMDEARTQFDGALAVGPDDALALYGRAACRRAQAIKGLDMSSLDAAGQDLPRAKSLPGGYLAGPAELDLAAVRGWIERRAKER